MRIKEEYRETKEINKSKFITCLITVKNEMEARAYIEHIRKEYNDATHVCTAFAIGENREIRRSNDNGEPSGTAGIPMLEAILRTEVTDVCACVVRYFGGIKLGASGLIRAYAGSVTSALAAAPKIKDVIYDHYRITYPYNLSGTLETWLRRNTRVIEMEYGEKATCTFLSDKKDLADQIMNITHGQAEAEYLGTMVEEADV